MTIHNTVFHSRDPPRLPTPSTPYGKPQMHKLWAVRVQDGNGREIYGAGYSDIWAINRLHYKAASPVVCDHVRPHPPTSNHFTTCEYSLRKSNFKYENILQVISSLSTRKCLYYYRAASSCCTSCCLYYSTVLLKRLVAINSTVRYVIHVRNCMTVGVSCIGMGMDVTVCTASPRLAFVFLLVEDK